MLVSILDYFQEKLITKVFSKKPYFGAILGPICSNLGKNEFSWKIFLDIPIIYHHAKNQKKLLCYFWEKCWTDRRTGRQTKRQTDNSDFIGPSVGWGLIDISHIMFLQCVWIKPHSSSLINLENLKSNFGQSVQNCCREEQKEENNGHCKAFCVKDDT